MTPRALRVIPQEKKPRHSPRAKIAGLNIFEIAIPDPIERAKFITDIGGPNL
jgi:hypothetical protein